MNVHVTMTLMLGTSGATHPRRLTAGVAWARVGGRVANAGGVHQLRDRGSLAVAATLIRDQFDLSNAQLRDRVRCRTGQG
jgi:hypothetical protein